MNPVVLICWAFNMASFFVIDHKGLPKALRWILYFSVYLSSALLVFDIARVLSK